MHFRCPNCHHPIQLDEGPHSPQERTLDAVVCPSCHSQFSLSENLNTTVVAPDGRRVEHFELRDLLGQGSYGVVYKAWDTQLQRTVAIKLPRRSDMSPSEKGRFLHEARMAAAITSPNVVSVYEIGQYEDQYYIASQFIDGLTLRELLRIRCFSPRESAELLLPLLRGIQLFHDQGIIHRDLKPGNILIDPAGTPLVADFGLARREHPVELTVTQSGKIIGTVLYMSPEQARGENRSVTFRTDIFAMGVILYELLTGNRPFEATESRTVLHRIVSEDPMPPRRIKPGIPKDLETICLKALRKDPSQRYSSAGAMADDLQRFLDGKPVLARPVSVVEKFGKLVRRNRLLSAVTAISLIAVCTSLWQFLSPVHGTVPVLIATANGQAELEFVRYDSVLRIPHESGFRAQGASGKRIGLIPGLYRITGTDSDGRFHEVWRTVPELPTQSLGDPRYPHRAWSVKDDTIVLQPFRLFRDADVPETLVVLRGGEFDAGIAEHSSEIAARHRQTVRPFLLGINEVTYGTFRKVMDQPVWSESAGSTWLDEFSRQYGDRSHIPDEMPVTGYPVDVAIVFCELAGGRLPDCIEWEFAATQGGTTLWPTGDLPPENAPDELMLLAVSATTSDSTVSGIRNLCSSAAEYTDSRCVAYTMLYPNAFSEEKRVRTSVDELVRLPELVEVRGAPDVWIRTGATAEPANPRSRIVAPFPPADADAEKVYGRIGWRIARSAF